MGPLPAARTMLTSDEPVTVPLLHFVKRCKHSCYIRSTSPVPESTTPVRDLQNAKRARQQQ